MKRRVLFWVAPLAVIGLLTMRPAFTDSKAEVIVDAHTNLKALNALVSVPGEPKVVWARLPMGKITATAPGPTDLMVMAALIYSDELEAGALLNGARGDETTLDVATEPERYSWLPADLLGAVVEGRLAITHYGPLTDFGGADISQVTGAPEVLLLRKALP